MSFDFVNPKKIMRKRGQEALIALCSRSNKYTILDNLTDKYARIFYELGNYCIFPSHVGMSKISAHVVCQTIR